MSDENPDVAGVPAHTLDPRLEECTCLWTASGRRASIYLAGDACPAWPHPRSYTWQEVPRE